MKRTVQTILMMALLALNACTSEHHDNFAGTPDRWWSDNYFAMVQDANGSDDAATPGGKKPIRMKLP